MQVTLAIDETGADPERLQELTQDVRDELSRLDLDEVAPAPGGAPPPGTRGLDVAAVGALLVSLGGSAEAVHQLLTVLQAWVGRGRRSARSVELTVGDRSLRISDATLDQQDRLVEEFARLLRAS